MSVRVTQNMMNSNFLFNLNKTNNKMDQYQNQLSSGKKINKPSDNPVTAVRGMFYQSSLNEIDQFKRNADDGTSWMNTTDSALDEVTSVLQRVRELTVQGQNGSNSDTDRAAIASEISQLREHLGEVANTQIAGKYVFAGTDVKNPPYRNDPSVPNSPAEFKNTNTQSIDVQVGQTNSVAINIPGTKVFNNDGAGGIFKVLDNIVAGFTSATSGSTDHLSELDGQLDNILRERAELGGRMNRMDLSSSRLDGLEVSTTSLLSQEEDIDVSQVITDLKAEENVQRAALSVGARIIQPSLVDFLR